MKRIQLLPNIITAFGLSCGLFLIFKMSIISAGEIDQRILMPLAGIFLLAGVADVLDGAVARAMKVESEFGGLFDSLSDAITFGVAPSVIVLKSLSISPGTTLSFCLSTAAMVYSVCGVLRLVRFNVTNMMNAGNKELIDAGKKHFTGLPIPGAAAAIISVNLFLISDDFHYIFSMSEAAHAWVLFFALIVVGYLMVSRLRFHSLKSLRIPVVSFRVVFPAVICMSLIFYGVMNHFPLIFLLISWTYVMIGWVLSIARLIAGKRSKVLEEFEPEPEEFE